MTERPPSAAHLQISKLLMVMVVLAVASTGALIVTLVVGNPPRGGGGGSNPNGMPPPPPDSASIALTVITGLFVLAWLAVLVVFSRDQILLRLRQQQPVTGPGGVSREELTGLLADLRAELASDREHDYAGLGERLAELTAEYGERRETDGYLSGMRMATTDDPSSGNVRALRRPPPPR
jgi:hypothetical protein